jgi:hypothetical protein
VNDYQQWAAKHPHAAAELEQILGAVTQPTANYDGDGKSEAWAQQQVRLKAAHVGAMTWRNNVGATPAKCPDCEAPRQPIRYGLANDSAKLNKQIKSSDLILAIPRLITQDMVGRVIAQFGSIETKRPGWHYTGKEQEPGQAAWLALIARLGGYATFSTGELNL